MTISTPSAVLAGVVIGVTGVAAYQAINPQLPLMQANQYMQNSAEYRALCLQTYSWAGAILRTKVRAARWMMERAHENKAPAIIMDLDETVVDNSGFQSYLDREALTYTDPKWLNWEKFEGDLPLIPGAKQFIADAEAQGVTVVYVSNRSAINKEWTIKSIAKAGISTLGIEGRILLREVGKPSDKTERRATVAAKYNVLMLVGDNLRDFAEAGFVAPKVDAKDPVALRKAIEDRKAAVEATAGKFGSEWIILPNPVYGEFDKLKGEDPRKTLRETQFGG